MTTRDAVGVGCRAGTRPDAIESLVRDALALVPDLRPRGMFTIADKAAERGLAEAAERLSLDLVFLSREVLRRQEASVLTRSRHAERRFGVASVAEASALAGAGMDSVLIVHRLVRDGVTCAIAGCQRGGS